MSNVEIGRTAKITQLREDTVAYLEDLLADKLEEVAMIQKQLTILSAHHVRDTDKVDPYGDVGKYTGQIHNEKSHGKGTMKYDDGRIYVGTSVVLGCNLVKVTSSFVDADENCVFTFSSSPPQASGTKDDGMAKGEQRLLMVIPMMVSTVLTSDMEREPTVGTMGVCIRVVL